jgi:glycosyltransferase involved in cell wall biosynthesis
MQADVVLIALADVSRDARTLNLGRALAHAGLKVAIVASAPVDWSDPAFTLLRWPDPGGSALRRWRHLLQFVRQSTITGRVIGAMDFFAVHAARHIARRTRANIIYDMREFYFALGPLEGRGLKQSVIAWLERRFLRTTPAPSVIVTSSLDADIVADHYSLRERPHVLMNTPPYRDRVASTVLRDRFNIPSSDLVVLYQGAVLHGRGIAPFMRSMANMPDVHLCIVGDGPAQRDLADEAERLGITAGVHWYGSVPYDELHAVTCSADVGLCLIEPVSKSYEYALPNKLFEYMMARIPSLVSDLPALRRQLAEAPVGVLVEPSLSTQAIVEAMERLRVPATRQAFIDHCEGIRDLAYERQALRAVDLFREKMH